MARSSTLWKKKSLKSRIEGALSEGFVRLVPVPHLFVTRAPAEKDFSSTYDVRVDHSLLNSCTKQPQFLDLTNVAIDSIDEAVPIPA